MFRNGEFEKRDWQIRVLQIQQGTKQNCQWEMIGSWQTAATVFQMHSLGHLKISAWTNNERNAWFMFGMSHYDWGYPLSNSSYKWDTRTIVNYFSIFNYSILLFSPWHHYNSSAFFFCSLTQENTKDIISQFLLFFLFFYYLGTKTNSKIRKAEKYFKKEIRTNKRNKNK